jgi:hypothetical protein
MRSAQRRTPAIGRATAGPVRCRPYVGQSLASWSDCLDQIDNGLPDGGMGCRMSDLTRFGLLSVERDPSASTFHHRRVDVVKDFVGKSWASPAPMGDADVSTQATRAPHRYAVITFG